MSAEHRDKPGFTFTGWHMLTIMLLFFGTIISVNVTMAWNAVTSWSGLVVQNTYVASQSLTARRKRPRPAQPAALLASFISMAML